MRMSDWSSDGALPIYLERWRCPAERGAGAGDLLGPERGAVRGGGALLLRGAAADDGLAGDQAGQRALPRPLDGDGDSFRVMEIGSASGTESVCQYASISVATALYKKNK